jgi:hypothetical protein
MKKAFALMASAAVLATGVSAAPAAAQLTSEVQSARAGDVGDAIVKWHDVMLDVHAVDFRDPGAVAPEQVGPTRTSRAFAMVMTAVYDAVNAFDGSRTSYNEIPAARPGASQEVAVAYAARDMIVHLWPAQTASVDAILAQELTKIGARGAALNRGRTVGQNAAAAMIARRTGDGSEVGEVMFGEGGSIATGGNNAMGQPINSGATTAPNWTPDPVTANPTTGLTVALGANWGAVEPFALNIGSQFRAAPPPATRTARYRRDFNDVKLVGQQPNGPTGVNDEADEDTNGSTERGIFIADFWGYDGVPRLGVPPRLYGQIADVLAERGGIRNPAQLARFYALVHISMADSGISAWDSKYFYNYWRPVTGVEGNDGDPATVSVPGWRPVGVSMANVPAASAARATPPFPAYVSGHATFGASLFETARGFMPENTSFTFVSDEYNGITTDPFLSTTVRPLVPVRYRNLTAPALENARSRILNGVHWQFDGDEGVKMGTSIAKFARQTLFRPTN